MMTAFAGLGGVLQAVTTHKAAQAVNAMGQRGLRALEHSMIHTPALIAYVFGSPASLTVAVLTVTIEPCL